MEWAPTMDFPGINFYLLEIGTFGFIFHEVVYFGDCTIECSDGES